MTPSFWDNWLGSGITNGKGRTAERRIHEPDRCEGNSVRLGLGSRLSGLSTLTHGTRPGVCNSGWESGFPLLVALSRPRNLSLSWVSQHYRLRAGGGAFVVASDGPSNTGRLGWLIEAKRFDERIMLILAYDCAECSPDVVLSRVVRLVIELVVDGFAQLLVFGSCRNRLVRAGRRPVRVVVATVVGAVSHG